MFNYRVTTHAMAKKDPISLLIVDLEKRSGGTFLLMEHLEDCPPPKLTTAWLLSKEHMILGRPVATLAFQVSFIFSGFCQHSSSTCSEPLVQCMFS